MRKVSLSKDGHGLIVVARLPEGASAGDTPQLFVAGPDGWSLAPAKLQERRSGGATFSVPVTGRPEPPGRGGEFTLVLRDGSRSIETTKTLR